MPWDFDNLRLQVLKDGTEWYLTTKDLQCSFLFYGLNVISTTINAFVIWEDEEGNQKPAEKFCPKKIVLACDHVSLHYHRFQLANEYFCKKIEVTGKVLVEGVEKTFRATGPGWGWRQRP